MRSRFLQKTGGITEEGRSWLLTVTGVRGSLPGFAPVLGFRRVQRRRVLKDFSIGPRGRGAEEAEDAGPRNQVWATGPGRRAVRGAKKGSVWALARARVRVRSGARGGRERGGGLGEALSAGPRLPFRAPRTRPSGEGPAPSRPEWKHDV